MDKVFHGWKSDQGVISERKLHFGIMPNFPGSIFHNLIGILYEFYFNCMEKQSCVKFLKEAQVFQNDLVAFY